MKIKQIVKANNMPVQTVELKDKTGKGRTYNAKTYKTHGQAQQSVATFRSLIRKTRSDKGKPRAPYNIVKKFDPNAQLKKDMREVNRRLMKVQKDLERNASAKGRKRDTTLTSKPAALQAVENWADSDKKGKFFNYALDKRKGSHLKFVQFDEKSLDKLEQIIADPNSTKEQIAKAKEEKRIVKEMIYGNNKTDYMDKRVGMLNAKSLTKEGREELHEDAYQTFISHYKSEIGDAGLTEDEYNDMWKIFNDMKERAEAAGAYAYFYSNFQAGIKDEGLLQMDTSDFHKWLEMALETSKQEAQLTRR